MELKEYQKKTLEQVKIYLESLAEYRGKYEKAIAVDPDFAIDFPFIIKQGHRFFNRRKYKYIRGHR